MTLRLPRQMRHAQRPLLPLQPRFRHIHNLRHGALLHFGCCPTMELLYSADLAAFIKCVDKISIVLVNFAMLARRLPHSPRHKPFTCIASPPLCGSSPSFSHSNRLFSITYSLFSQNTRVAYLCAASALSASRRYHLPLLLSPLSSRSLIPDRFSILFRINTCKSVTKQTTLTSFRINTYEKPGEGGGGGKKQVPRANAALGMTPSLRSDRDALKHAPTLDLVKTKRQDVATDALPLALLVFRCFYCCG